MMAMIVLLILAGFLLASRISNRLGLLERLGWAFPIGLAAVTWLMMLCDWMGVGITAGLCRLLTVAVLLAAAVSLVPVRKDFAKGLAVKADFSWFNLLWVALLIVLAQIEWGNLMKCLYFPVYDRDSMAAFDTVGYLCAQEHTYKGLSIFLGDYMPKMHQAGSCISYVPMLQLAYAYVYSLGAETSKIVPALFYISFILGFYSLTARAAGHTGAMLATLMAVATPEMLSFSSLSITNVMQAVVAGSGLMYVCLWTRSGQSRDVALGCVLIAVNVWLRSEGIVFGGVAGLIVLWQCLRKKAAWWIVALPVATLLPLVLFSIYAAGNGLTSESAVIARVFWDGEKAATIANGALGLVWNDTFYGWTFRLAALAAVANAYFMVRRGDNLCVLLSLLLSLLLYFVVLYHVDYKWDSLQNVLAYSAKRYMFCYVPMACYYIVTCHVSQLGLRWIERVCGFNK